MALVSVARRPSGQYSLIKVTALGMAAPSPRPVMKRQTTSWSRSAENADTRQATPMISTEPTNTALRPRRSASGPDGQGAERQAEQRGTQDRAPVPAAPCPIR